MNFVRFVSFHDSECRKQLHAEEVERKERDSFYYAPPGGESIANMCLRYLLLHGGIKMRTNVFL